MSQPGERNSNYRHGHCISGPERLRLYYVFHDAKRRCTKPGHRRYADYGGRGIRFQFPSLDALLADIGPRPKGYTLDRIDNNGDYAPGNVRWATMQEQNRNRRKRSVYPPKVNGRWARR